MAWTSPSPSSTNSAQLVLVQALGLPPQVLVFLQALLASKKHRTEQEVTALLREAAELHFSSMQGLPLGSEYFEKLDPLFLVCIAREYLFFCPKQVRGGCTFMAGVRSTGLDRGRDPLASQQFAQAARRSPGAVPAQVLTRW